MAKNNREAIYVKVQLNDGTEVEYGVYADTPEEALNEALQIEKGNVVSAHVKPSNNLAVKLDLDATDAIKALKAIQREARETTKTLRELEKYHLSEIPTEVLTSELLKREDIECYNVAAHEESAKITIHGPREGSTYLVDGPAKIIVNYD
jgi:hypothetical protein